MRGNRIFDAIAVHVALGVLLISVALAVPGWGQPLDWAIQHGGDANGNAIAVDEDGNSYVTGAFRADATFGSGEANETTLSGEGWFVARYGSDGGLLWVTRASDSADDWMNGITGIAVDGDGNSTVTGSFSGTFFMAKYDSEGSLLRTTRVVGSVRGHDIAVDGDGDSYVAGSFSGSAVFGPGEIHETALTGGSDAIFIARYNGDGTLLWVTQDVGGVGGIAVDGDGNSYVAGSRSGQFSVAKYAGDGRLLWFTQAAGPVNGSGIAVDADGNSYVTGVFNSLATFGPGEENETTLEDSHGFSGYNDDVDIFVAKYSGDGSLLWARTEYIPWDMEGTNDIAVDGAGNSYVTGLFSGDATFGRGESNETTLSRETGLDDVFVAGYDTDGNLLWVRQAGAEGYSDYAAGEGVAADGAGNVFITGYFVGTATFGSGEINETVLTASSDYAEIFVAKYSPYIFQDLIEMIEGFNLNRGIETSLIAKLRIAREAMESDNPNQRRNAVKILGSFIDEVDAQRGVMLTEEQADRLINSLPAGLAASPW